MPAVKTMSVGLIKKARLARKRAYSPYSEFSVGAAVLVDPKKTFSGSNVENASFGLTICAERVAIFNAVSAGAKKISELAVSCGPASNKLNKNLLMPCGACLQVMAEFGGRDLLVHVDHVGTFTLDELLPRAFQFFPQSK